MTIRTAHERRRPTAEELEEQQTRRLCRYAVRALKGVLVAWVYVGILAHNDPSYSGPWLPIGMLAAFVATAAVDTWAHREP